MAVSCSHWVLGLEEMIGKYRKQDAYDTMKEKFLNLVKRVFD